MPSDPRLPARLRELRGGMSFRRLGELVNYSHVYLWRIERGDRPAPPGVMRRVGEALGVGDELERLAGGTDSALDGDAQDRLAQVTQCPRRVDQASLDGLATILDVHRRMEDQIGAGQMWAPARAQLRLAETVLREATGGVRRAAADLAAQQAQFTGWVALASGRRDAVSLFRKAERLAGQADSLDMVATARSFIGYAAERGGRPTEAIAASRTARKLPGIYVGQVAYDIGQEARGHARRGDAQAVLELLAEHRDLTEATVTWIGPVNPWHYYRTPAFFAMERGLVLALLGRYGGERKHAVAAVAALTDGLAGMPADQRGAQWLADPFLLELAETQFRLGDRAGAATLAEVERIAATTGSPTLARRARAVAQAAGATPHGF